MRWIFLRKLTFIVLLVILWASLAQGAWYDSNWQYRKPITIDPSKVLADQTDFPVLVNLAADADLQTHAQLDGDDILFTSADGVTQLSHEIESYDGAAGNLVAWVKVPALSGSASTVIYLYFGNGPIGPQEDGQNVWIAEYSGVWHLDEDQTGTGNNDVYLDSAFPFNPGSDHIAATGQEGKIGKGQQFSGDGDYISVPHHASLNLDGPMTLSYWIKLSGDAGEWNRVIEKGNGGFSTAYYFGGGDGTNDVTYYLTDTEVFDTADNALTTGNWHHVAVTYASNGDATFILNGTATPSGNYSGMIVGNTDSLYVSNPNPIWDSEGYLDEIRIAGADLGADWVITEYNNQSAPADFYTVGPEENLFHISGTVFEDADFAGTASAYDGGASDLALANVDVELYDGADTFIGTTTTAGDGTFSFTGLTDGSYKVRVRSATIGDADTPPAGGLNADVPATWPYPLAEMTWGYGSALYGGQSSTADDSDTGDDSGPGDSYVIVTVNGGHLTGIDIGFAYNLIVNTLDDGLSNNTRSNQGSLRQFLKNANGIGAAGGTTANYCRFRIPGPGPHTVSTVSALPVIVETATLDGDDAGGGRVAIDGTTAGNVIGLSLSGSDITVANLVIQNFFGASSEGIRIHDGTGRNTISNCLIQDMNLDGIRVDWLGADTDLDHQITGCTVSGSGHDGIVLVNVDGISVTNCIIEGSTRHGMNLVGANNGSGNNLIAGNTIRGNGNRGISIWDTGCTGNIFHSNIIHSNYNDGLGVGSGGNETRIYHNVFDNNGTSGNGSGVIVSPGVTGVIARNTLFTNNNSYGFSDGDGGTSTSIDYSGFYGNGTAACNYDYLTGSQNITPDPQYAPPGPPASFSLTECSSPAINAGIDLGVDQPDLNGSDPGNFYGPAPDMGAIEASCGATAVYEISGLVFEDIVGDVLDDGAIGDANNPGVEGVDVYLYLDDGDAGLDAGDTLIGGAPAQTDASGNYSFPGLNDGDYFVVVDSKTVGSTQDPAAVQADIWAEQTYGPVGAYFDNGFGYGIRVSAGPCYGGIAGHLSDDFSQWDDREHRAIVTVSGSNVSNIDFGFSFNVVTNLAGGDARDDDIGANRTMQGSLRQFIQNANAIDATNVMRFVPAESPGAVDGLGNSWWRLMVTEILPTITGDGTTIDGSAFDHLDGTTPLNPNASQIGVGLPVGTEGNYTPPKLDPELEIRNFRGTAVLPTGLVFEATDSVLRHVSIWGFGDSASTFDANVRFGTNFSTTPDFTGSLVEFCVIGTGPAAFTEPGAAELSGRKNLTMRETDNAIVRDNLIGFAGNVGVDFNSASNSGLVLRNEFRHNGILDPVANPVYVWISGNVTGNLITDNASGIYSAPTPGISYQDNTITANGWGGTRPNAIQVSGSSVTIQRNVVADNAGAAVVVNSTTTGTQVTRNSIHGNGAVTSQIGIDLLASGDDSVAGPFVTVNDDGDVDAGGNDLLNYPVLDTARLQGADLIVTGWARPASQIEFYVADPDPLGFGEGETWLITKTEGTGDDTDATTTTYGPGAVNGIVQGTDTTNRFSFTIPLASLAAPVVISDELTALAILGGNTSEFSGYVAVDGFTISGTVFEDANFAGTASNWDNGVNDLGLDNVDVELYDGLDAYVTSVTTDAGGAYTFTGLSNDTYKVRTRSATIGDADTPPAGGLHPTVPATWPYPLADMTWAHGTALIGGQDTSGDDTDTGDNAGPGDTWVAVTISGGDVSGVNFGFCYDLIVNENDDAKVDNLRSKQGTLRQFIKNSNAIMGVNKSWFLIALP